MTTTMAAVLPTPMVSLATPTAGQPSRSPEATAPADASRQADASNPWTRLAEVLDAAGITRVFGLPDDDMQSQRALETVGIGMRWSTRQSSAVHMAAGSARTGPTAGVCVVGRGPAVAALVPGLLEALHAHVPLVVLASGTADDRRGTGAFQDAPTLEMMAPVTKWAARLSGGPEDADLLRHALSLASQTPAGPVYLEVPDGSGFGPGSSRPSRAEEAAGIRRLLERAERPLILIGGGAASVPRAELVGAAVSLGAGVVSTASGRGNFPESHARYLGLAGLYMGTPVARTVNRADAVLVLGSSLEETAMTGMPLQAEWIQVNANAADIRHWLPGAHRVMDARDLASLLPATAHRTAWGLEVDSARSEALRMATREQSLSAEALDRLGEVLPEDSVVVQENGLHDIWSYCFPHFVLPDGATCVAPSEQTTLGCGVAAAAGIAEACGPLVVCLTGDTALATFRPDLEDQLATARRLLYIVFDDGGMGWLDRQARLTGAAGRFLGGPRALAPTEAASTVHVYGPEGLSPVLAGAVDRALRGLPTVVRLHVTPSDVAPPLRAVQHDRECQDGPHGTEEGR